MEAEILTQDNFQTSFIEHIDTDRRCWEYPIKDLVQELRVITDEHQNNPISRILSDAFLPLSMTLANTTYDHIQSDKTQEMLFWYSVLTTSVLGDPARRSGSHFLECLSSLSANAAYQKWWNRYGQEHISQLCHLANMRAGSRIAPALTAYARGAIPQLKQAIQQADPGISFWASVYETTAPGFEESEVWQLLLQSLGEVMNVHGYQQWWTQCFGREILADLRAFVDKHPQSTLFAGIITYAGKGSFSTSGGNFPDLNSALLWGEALATCAPVSSAPYVWGRLFRRLSDIPYTSAYQRWWKQNGGKAIKELRIAADSDTELANDLAPLTEKAMEYVSSSIAGNDENAIVFWADVFGNCAPPASMPGMWTRLLQHFTTSAMQTRAFQSWWGYQGHVALRVLRGLVDRQPGGALALALTFFAGNAFAEFQSIIHAHSTAVGINDVIFWNDVIVNAAPPAIEPKPWVELLDSLTTEVICAATYQQWWTTCQGEQTIGHSSHRA